MDNFEFFLFPLGLNSLFYFMLFKFQDNEAAREKWKDLRIFQIEYAVMNYKRKYHTLWFILIVLEE